MLKTKLNKLKAEIIDFAIDQWDEYSPEWLAQEIVDVWWEELPGVDVQDVLEIIKKWDDEIEAGIEESLEPSAREEALAEIRGETIEKLRE